MQSISAPGLWQCSHSMLDHQQRTMESHLERMRRNDPAMKELDLSGSHLGGLKAAELAGALEGNSTLVRLDLWGNDIGDAGASALAMALQHNSTLTKLDLSYNRIGVAGRSQGSA